MCAPKERGGLGFRDLHAFNLALLAKQGWRVLENPESLISRMYKARYFPNSTFWDAPVPVMPSFSWRSILAAKDMLRRGIRWQIGSGTEVCTWSDPWLPKPPSFLPLPRHHEVSNSSRVADFILPSRCWDNNKIMETFEASDAELILTLPLSDRLTVDKRVWHPESKGLFSVKTAYRVALEVQSSEVLLPSDGVSNDIFIPLWKSVWHAHIPAYSKICVWKVAINILPTAD